jgi:glyoxylase-like metal-dependent hydrolase (beta-lactamase superfamily II)
VARDPAIELAPGVFRIPTMGAAGINSFAVVEDDGSVTLVDCGLKRAPARIVAGLRAIGRHPGDVRRIVLTHAHSDHAGGAADLAARTGAPVAVHEGDAAAVEAGRHPHYDPSLRAARVLTRLPGGRFPPVRVDERLTDGQVLDGGLRVVATPGHTPGSLCLLHEPSGTLLVGDTLFHRRRLRPSPRPLCSDFRLNERSARLLGELEYERVGFAHGHPITERAREAVRRVVATGGVDG